MAKFKNKLKNKNKMETEKQTTETNEIAMIIEKPAKEKVKFTIQEVIDMHIDRNLERDEYQLLYEGYETQLNKKGYLQFRLNIKDKWKRVHTLVNKYYNIEEHDIKFSELIETALDDYLVTHHKDLTNKNNKLNNHPDNLQWMGVKEHFIYHSTISILYTDMVWNKNNPKYPEYHEQREKLKITMSENGKKNLESLKNGENGVEFCAKALKNMLIAFDKIWDKNNPEYVNNEAFRNRQYEIVKEASDKMWDPANPDYPKYEENRKRQAESMRELSKKIWDKNNPNYQKYEKVRETQLNRLDLLNKEQWHGKNNAAFREKILLSQKEGRDEYYKKYREDETGEMKKKKSDSVKEYYSHIENREKASERAKIFYSNPDNLRSCLATRIFKTFAKMIKLEMEITNDNYDKFRDGNKGITKIGSVFETFEDALEGYKNCPKRLEYELAN